jgi:four helix bundle protein
MRDFHDLNVWQRAHEVTLEVYRATADFPREEQFGLTAQVRRSAQSVAANFAEGCGRDGDAEFSRFLHIAMGSASETEYLLWRKIWACLRRRSTPDATAGVVSKRMLTV